MIKRIFSPHTALLAALICNGLMASTALGQPNWPDLSSPPKAVGGGENDAAVIVGLENYAFVAPVPGAQRNARDWQAYLTDTLKVPTERVNLLRDREATVERIRKYASKVSSEVKAGGTLWFIFIGHGAPSQDGTDGILVGADAQQDADSLFARSLPRDELIGLLSKGKQAKTVVLVDACFSGRTSEGVALVEGLQPLIVAPTAQKTYDSRTVLMTAGKSDQFAGPLPRNSTMRPAFSYLALGALRGWARDINGNVTAKSLIEFSRKALSIETGRIQTPELSFGKSETILGAGAEDAPNLASINRAEGSKAELVTAEAETDGYRFARANIEMLEFVMASHDRYSKLATAADSDAIREHLYAQKRSDLDLSAAITIMQPFVKNKNISISRSTQLTVKVLQYIRALQKQTAKELLDLTDNKAFNRAQSEDKFAELRARTDDAWVDLLKTVGVSGYGMLEEPKEPAKNFTTFSFTEKQRLSLLSDLEKRWGPEVKDSVKGNRFAGDVAAALLYKFFSNTEFETLKDYRAADSPRK